MAGADPAVLQNLEESEHWTTATDTDSEEITLSWNTLSLVKQTNKQKQNQKEFSSSTDPNWQELLYFVRCPSVFMLLANE